MRVRIIAHVLGVLSFFIALGLAASAGVAWLYSGDDVAALGLGAAVPLLLGGLTLLFTRGARGADLGVKEGFAIVAFGWLLSCVYGAVPYALYPEMGNGACEDVRLAGSEFCSLTNAMFESTSGFTTTGASILSHGLWPSPDGPSLEAEPAARARLLPHGILFWRALTHWFGGMGIVVLSLAILPYLGIGGMQLYRAEVPGPTSDKLSPRLADTAKILWAVYVGLTVAEVLALKLAGMSVYNAVTHAFATMATGGFSTLAASVGGFGSPLIESIITLFMFLAGANFTLHFLALTRGPGVFARDSEFRFYSVGSAVLILGLALIVLGNGHAGDIGDALRLGAFQVVSIATTTGFATADFGLWAPAGQYLLLLLMFVGGCGGSTGGGPKVVRILALVKIALREIVRVIHPKAVIKVRINARPVEESTLSAIVGFMLFFMGLFAVSSLVLTTLGMDILSATTAVAANIGNVGPGLGAVGPASHYNDIAAPGKWLLTFLMLVGRLEVFTILVLFARSFWRR
jgi:trk system potassium uptake protein